MKPDPKRATPGGPGKGQGSAGGPGQSKAQPQQQKPQQHGQRPSPGQSPQPGKPQQPAMSQQQAQPQPQAKGQPMAKPPQPANPQSVPKQPVQVPPQPPGKGQSLAAQLKPHPGPGQPQASQSKGQPTAPKAPQGPAKAQSATPQPQSPASRVEATQNRAPTSPSKPAPSPLAPNPTEPRGLERYCAERLDYPAVRTLFERLASTPLGRRTLLELQPRHGPEARQALERVRELCAQGGTEPPLGELCDAPAMLRESREQRRALSVDELSSLLSFLVASMRLSAWLKEHAGSLPNLALLGVNLPDMTGLAQLLQQGLDGRGGIRDDASPKLQRLREAVRLATQNLERRAQAIVNRPEVRVALADGSGGRAALRDGRLVLAIKAKSAGRVRGLVHDRSQTGETLFVEPAELIEEGNRLAAARSDEGHEVQRLLVEWTRTCLDRAPAIERVAEALGELELAVIGLRFCRRYGAIAPQLPEKNAVQELILRQARHPLLVEQELTGQIERCVPVDLRLGGDFDVLVITGPNTGGKTLALKTAGLAGLLARLGLPFPCAPGSQVPLYGAIVADIGDEQEIEQSLSTFSAHLKRIAAGLPLAGEGTLFLLDELGGGTDPADGAALGTALLDHLRRLRAPTLASTHIGRLKEFAFRHARVENACAEFDTRTLRPLYTLLLGTPGESRALSIARRLGFSPELIARAEALVERPSDESRRLMEDIREARTEAERSRLSADATRQRIVDMERELEQLRGNLEQRERSLLGDAERVLEQRLSAARAAYERGQRLLEQLPAAQRQTFDPVFAELGEALSGAALSDARSKFLAGLRKGDTVYVPRYQKRCPVLKIDREKGRIKLRLGKQELELPLDDISAYEEL